MLRVTAFNDGDWRSIPFESLERDFLEICEAHRAQGRALAFAFILFDRSHPYVRSALAQRNYWDALDERSGRHLSVFSLDVRSDADRATVERRGMYASAAPTYDRISLALAKFFDGVGRISLPCVLFFQVADGRVIDTAVASLAGGNLSDTYKELEAVIGSAADAVAKVEDQHAQNAEEVFNLITAALRDRREGQGFVRLVRVARPVVELAAALQLVRELLP